MSLDNAKLLPEHDWLEPGAIALSLFLSAASVYLLTVCIVGFKRMKTHPEWNTWSRWDVTRRVLGISVVILVALCMLLALFLIYWVRLTMNHG